MTPRLPALLPALCDERDVFALADALARRALPAVNAPPTLEELVGQTSPTDNPLVMYLRGLPSPRSQATMMSSARTLLATLSPDVDLDPLTFAWHRLTVRETSAIRAAMLRRFAPASVNRNISCLRGIVGAAWQLGLVSAEERDRAVHPKVLKAVPNHRLPVGRSVTAAEFRTLDETMAADGHTIAAIRDCAILAIGHGGGLRRAEIAGLDVDDVNADDGAVTVLHGKGGKQRVTYLAGGALDALVEWLALRAELVSTGVLTGAALFCPVNKGGRALDRRVSGPAILAMLRRRAAEAGVAQLTSHDLRRSYASDHLDGGSDIATVQKLMGHSSVTTTAQYDRRGERTKQAAAGNVYHPHTTRHLTPPPVVTPSVQSGTSDEGRSRSDEGEAA